MALKFWPAAVIIKRHCIQNFHILTTMHMKTGIS